MERPRRRVILIGATVLAATLFWFFFGTHSTPAGQPPLFEISASALDQFKSEFNQASDETRVVLLLSPT